MEYLPFGETLADEHLNSHNSPFKYNGKELDDETGNFQAIVDYYYGLGFFNSRKRTAKDINVFRPTEGDIYVDDNGKREKGNKIINEKNKYESNKL